MVTWRWHLASARNQAQRKQGPEEPASTPQHRHAPGGEALARAGAAGAVLIIAVHALPTRTLDMREIRAGSACCGWVQMGLAGPRCDILSNILTSQPTCQHRNVVNIST